MGLIDKLSAGWRTTKYLAINTKAEVFVLATAGIISGLVGSCQNEQNRARYIPISFSEISQLQDSAAARGEELDPLTKYYASVNDFSAKIFEAWNDESIFPRLPEHQRMWFAQKLDQAMDTTQRLYSHNLRDFAESIPSVAQNVLRDELSDLQRIRAGTSVANSYLNNSWDDSHIDSYRTEVYTTIDSEGNPQVRTRQVYDHTDHSFDYNKRIGEMASLQLNKITTEEEPVELLDIKVPKEIGAWNEQVIRRGIKLKEGEINPQAEEILRLAQLFKTGSAYQTGVYSVIGLWDLLREKDTPAWTVAKRTAKSESYRTNSHYDDGPREFQVAETALNHGTNLVRGINNILDPIIYTRDNIGELERKIKVFHGLVTPARHYPEIPEEEFEGKSARKVQREIIDMTKDIYKMNFPHGNDVNQFRGLMLLLWSFLGGIIGTAAGFGLDYTIDKLFGSNRIPRRHF
jgi:hypothetical protein